MTYISRLCLMALLTLAVAACGGGGGGGSSSGGGSGGGGGGTTTVTKNFTVSVDSVTINRVSNGDPVTVDTAALTQSGQVAITQ